MSAVPQRALARARLVVGALAGSVLLAMVSAFAADELSRGFNDIGMLSLTVLATVSCLLAAVASTGRLRLAWGAMAGACLSWAAGEAVWTWYELVLKVDGPFPSLADVGYLGFPLGAMLALAVFPANANRADRRRMTLDGLMAAVAIGLVSWGTALGAVVSAGGETPFATAVSVAYPGTDVALLVVCVLVLSRSRAHRVPLGVVAVGLMLMAVADSGYAYLVTNETYATGSIIDLGWFFAFGLIAVAPLAPGATSDIVRSATRAVAGVYLPYLPLGVAVAFIGRRYAQGHDFSEVEVSLMGALLLLVLLRQFLTVRDNQKLARTLAVREDELHYQAFHDRLTGLANRALFVDRVAHALELHRRDGRPLAICFVDLDGFKAVNDTLGHSAGDELLRQVSARFREVLSHADTLARFGGDEYAVLLEDRPDPIVTAQALLESLRAPFRVEDREISVLASIGVAQVAPVDPTPTVDELLRRADLAMYVVKRQGKGDVLLHTEGLQLDEIDDLTLGRSLAQALVDNQITLAFQPIIDLATGRPHTVEALARWAPEGRPQPPEVLIRVAERNNLIDPLFELVLAQACAHLARWTRLPDGVALRMAVNVSPLQLSSPGFPRLVAAELARHGLAGDRLVLEITESEALADKAASFAVCHELRRLGVRLSVDDFGSGLSSLARLKELPIDEVKIDRFFIADLDTDADSQRFVRGVLALANEIGLTVVAEGVEREAERDMLAALGCHRAQGFLFARPVQSASIEAMLVLTGSHPGQIPVPRNIATRVP